MRSLSRLYRSLTFRLALAYLALFMLSVAALLGGAYVAGVLNPLDRVQDGVEREAEALVAAYPREPRAAFVARLEARAAASDRRPAYHALIAPDGRLIAGNIPTWPAPKAQRDWLRFEFESYDTGDEIEHEALARDVTFADGVRLIVGRDTEDLDEREDFLSETLVWGAGLSILIGLAGGLMMSLTVGRRLDAVARAARTVIAGDLSGRVEVRGSGDDFDTLAETLNEMLARIEQLVQSISRVSDSIAHELRTPLTRLHADLEELTEASRRSPQTHRLARQAKAEAERLQSIFDSLLRIARIEAGRHVAEFKPVDLSTLLSDVAEFHRPEAEGKHQALVEKVDPDLTVEGDPNLLFQAVSNLLDNAVKYAPAHGKITLTARRDGESVVLSVCDTGPAVAAEHHPKLTERFFRAPDAAQAPGAGLGLALVAAVVSLHDGKLAFENLVGGFCANIALPSRRQKA
ncbi:MAG: HAMP domain-containing histidine kinase [Caulobacteraceae bacterium]|nr:HAMP domain-containing histidine kinase [Caulobacteraceae bacterium]